LNFFENSVIFAAQGAPPVFEKTRNSPKGILWGWGKTDSSKKPEAKNLVTLFLYFVNNNVADLDQHGSTFIVVSWIRIRIRIGNTAPDPDPGGPK
jgi:hypothetical protein